MCTDICLCLVLIPICIVLNICLIAFILKSHGWRKAVKNTRFWIFTLALAMNLCILVGNTFNFAVISEMTRRVLFILAWTLKYSVLILVGYYFIRRSRKLILVDDARKIRRL